MMRILEARESFIKFESEKNIPLSSFIQVESETDSLIAQVVKIQKVNDSFLVYAKLLYSYNGSFESYDGFLPEKDAQVKTFEFKKISQVFKVEKPVLVGKFIDKREDLFIDRSMFDKKTIVSAETPEFVETFIANTKQELSKGTKTFVIDMQGVISSPKYVAGKDFRLPLNTESLKFMYEDCLNDTTSDSKSLIKEIFQDLSEYSMTVPFLPFGALKTIVDDMVEKSHIFKLLVLKNKLNKFDKMGYFAANQSEAKNLDKILASQSAYIDLSKLDNVFQNRYFETIYNSLEEGTNVIVIASNSISKKNIKTILTKQGIASTFVTHPRFKYINEIKSMFKNFIIEPSFVNNEIFKAYSTFLSVMHKGTYLLVGEGTNYLPLISILEKFPEYTVIEEIENSEDSINVLSDALEALEDDDNANEVSSTDDAEKTVLVPEIEKDEQTEAIEKKSNELVEKITEDLEKTSHGGLSLFDDEQDEASEDEQNENNEDTDVDLTEEELELETKSENEITDDEEETLNEIALEAQEIEEISDDTIESVDNTLELIEDSIANNEVEELQEQAFEYHTQVDENQALEVSEDIIDMTEDAEAVSDEYLLDDESVQKETVLDVEENEIIEIPDEIQDDINNEVAEYLIEDISTEEVNSSDKLAIKEEDSVEEIEVLPIGDIESEVDEVIELDDSEISEDDIIVEIDDVDENEVDEALEKEIMEDVDKVFTTMKEDEALSDNDLDLIDELNNENDSEGFEELTELVEVEAEELEFVDTLEEVNDATALEEFEEEKEFLQTKKSATPTVPLYEADIPAEDLVSSDPIEQGDTVSHAKYGVGVVEKMVKYGNKTLYSINFENLGRRLLDPTLTEIKKN